MHVAYAPIRVKSSQESVIIMAIIGIIVTIIGAAIALTAILVPGQWAMRRDMSDLRKDIAALAESTRKDIAALNERMAKVEGLFEGFTKSSPQSTSQ